MFLSFHPLEKYGHSPTPPDVAYKRKFKNREKIDSYNLSTSQPPNPIPHSIIGLFQVISPWGNNIHIHHCNHYLSLYQPPDPHFPLNNGFLLPYRFLKPIYFRHLQIYLAVNLPHHTTTLGDVLLLTESCMISQILKCTGSNPTSWCTCKSLRSAVLFSFGKPLIP